MKFTRTYRWEAENHVQILKCSLHKIFHHIFLSQRSFRILSFHDGCKFWDYFSLFISCKKIRYDTYSIKVKIYRKFFCMETWKKCNFLRLEIHMYYFLLLAVLAKCQFARNFPTGHFWDTILKKKVLENNYILILKGLIFLLTMGKKCSH